MTPREQRFKQAITDCLAEGKWPTASQILPRVGRSIANVSDRGAGPKVMGGARFDGHEASWRREVMLEFGWHQSKSGNWWHDPACPQTQAQPASRELLHSRPTGAASRNG